MAQDTSPRNPGRSSPPHIATLMVLTGVSAMSMNMFLPSLPSMAVYFKTDYHVMQLSVALFLALNGAMQLVVGPASDRYGRRPVMLVGFAIFCVATLGCIYSANVWVFLVFRGLQVGVVVAMVLSRAVIRDLFPQDQAAAKIGLVTMGMAIVPMITPALGGYLDQIYGWQATFWVLFVSGLLALYLTWTDLGETNQSRSSSLRDQIRDYPELLKSPRFWGYALCAAFSSGTFFSYLGGAPYIGSEIFGLSPSTLGVLFGAPAAGYILGNFLSTVLAVRVGINALIVAGCIAAILGIGVSLILFHVGLGTATTFFGFMIFMGLGNGLVLPNAIAGSISVRPQLAGTASGLGGALMIGGGAALSALAGSLLGPGSGPYPLLDLQIAVSVMALVAIVMVIRREQRLARQQEA